MKHKTFLRVTIAALVSSFTAVQVTFAQGSAQPVPNKVTVEIKKISYKELKDGKHHVVVNWDFIDGGGGIGTSSLLGFALTKLVLEVELTDARGVKQKATRTLTAESASGGTVSFTPVPIPKNPVVAVPTSDIFQAAINPIPGGFSLLRFKATLTASAVTLGGTKRTITGVARKEGTVQAIR